MKKFTKYKSASNFLINFCGGLFFIISLVILNYTGLNQNIFILFFGPLISGYLFIVLAEYIFLKSNKDNTYFFLQKNRINYKRSLMKFWGVICSWLILLTIYSVIAEINPERYQTAFYLFMIGGIIFLPFSYIYIQETDRRLINPEDDLYHFAKICIFNISEVSFKELKIYSLKLLLKMFFLCEMWVWCSGYIYLISNDPQGYYDENISLVPNLILLKAIIMVYLILAAIDVFFASIGYVFTFKANNTDIKSVENKFIGWFVCLICYFPFFELMIRFTVLHYLFTSENWTYWFGEFYWIAMIWGVLVVCGQFFETLGTCTFGIRFSNLSYRGLITGGMFRFTKHPQYIGKMLNRFFFYVPFLSMYGISGVITSTTALAFLTFIYYLRAKTEEIHLTQNHPEYKEYALWMNDHGIFKWFTKKLPFMAYSAEKNMQGKLF